MSRTSLGRAGKATSTARSTCCRLLTCSRPEVKYYILAFWRQPAGNNLQLLEFILCYSFQLTKVFQELQEMYR
eukprot:g50367.t1